MKTEKPISWRKGFRTLLTGLIVAGLLLQSASNSFVTALSRSTLKPQLMPLGYSDPDTVTAIRYYAENDVGASQRNWSDSPGYHAVLQETFEYSGSHQDELSDAAIPELLSDPIQVLDSDNNYFLRIDLRDSRVHPRVLVANNDAGGLQTLSSMKNRIQGYSQWAIINADLFSGNCPAGQNCAQGLTYIAGQRKTNWSAYGSTWMARGNIGFDSSNNVQISVGDSQSKRDMTIAGGPRILIGGGTPTCYSEPDGPCGPGKTYFPYSGECFENAAYWCNDTRPITMIGYSADGRYLFMGISRGGRTPSQLAQWLKDRGAHEILRFDSGSSSGMYHNNQFIGGTGGKLIANAFAIVVDAAPPAQPCSAPSLRNPANGHFQTEGRTITFRWENVNCDHDGYTFRVKTVPNMDSGGQTVMDISEGGTERTVTFGSQWDNQDLYWSVRAANAPGGAAWAPARALRISPNQPPTIAFNTANGNSSSLIESREQNWTFQGTSADPDGSVNRVELRCSGDNCGSGATQASGTTSWSLTRSGLVGRNDVYFQVYDNQGASAISRHLDLRIDLAAPTTGHNLIGTAGSNGWHISPVEVRLHADDGSTGGARVGVDRVVYRLDGGEWQNRSGSDASLSVNSNGTHTVDYYAVDRVGNTENQKQVTFKIDTMPPSAPGTATEIHGVLSGQWQKTLDDPSFIWIAATDTASGIWYYRVNWNNTLQVTQGSAYDPPAVRTGSYELGVQAVDQAGNVGPVGATFIFRYDGTPPPAPAIQNHDGIASGVWQNRIRTPDFSWPTPTDQGSGVAGYNLYWGPSASGESATLVTSNIFVSTTPICAENEAATYYLRLRTQDGVGWQSEWVGYALAYDGAPPNATLIANYGLPVAHQTSIHLDIAASDQGSGVAQMRLSNSGYNWSEWLSPTSELFWEIPALGRREHAIYLQLVDNAGNVSDIISDTVYFDVNVPFPKSENFHMWDSLLAAGGGIITSTNLIQRVTVGQASESTALQSAQYLLNPGFQAGALAAPIQVPTYTTYMQLGSLMASATTSATAIASGHFRLYGSLGQPSDMRTVTSTNFTASLGFWAGAANDVTPEPPEPPEPLPPPECEFYSLSINNGALFTRSPLVTLNLCGPDPTQMMLSNDGGFSSATWQPYTSAISWTLATYGNYVLPRLVYARYRDGSNIIHGNFFDDIIYDPGAPEGAVAFDPAHLLPGVKLQAASQPLRMLQTSETELFLSFADDSSGMGEVQISLTPDFADASWQPYAGIVPLTFTEEGVQTVYVRTRDQAGNTSTVITDTLIVDTIPPLGSIYPIEVVGPNTLSLTMLLAAWDNVSGVSDVRIGTTESLENALWQPYAPEITVPISDAGVAQPILYAQFRDVAGNVSETYSTTYLVDTTAPLLYVEVAPDETLTRTLIILAYDELSQVGEMRLSNDPLFLEDAVTLPYTQTVIWGFDARRVVWVQVADSVGNRSEPFPAYAREGTTILESKVYLPLVLRQQ